VRRFGDRAATPRALALGLATALLPCGYLWAFVATAAATGRPLAATLVMLAFWAGTTPALAGVALLARRALGPLERRLPLVTAAALVVIGLLTVAGRIAPLESAVRAGAAAATHDCH
jgi:sulfite exporter TauE/SafE